MSARRHDAKDLNQHATGRWDELLTRIGGVPLELLDGRHHPCPKCGGTDRFRCLDLNRGSLYCNQCFSKKNGDGFSALQWLTEKRFPDVLADVAAYLGVSGNGQAKRPAKGKAAGDGGGSKNGQQKAAGDASPAKKAGPLSAFTPSSLDGETLRGLVEKWCAVKPPITVAGVRACRGAVGNWHGIRCIAFPGYQTPGERGADRVKGLVLVRLNGELFPTWRDIPERKSHNTGGSKESWAWAADVPAADTILYVEGLTDLAAAASAGLPAGWAAVANCCGAGSARGLDYSWSAGKRVLLNGDCDVPGQEGVKRRAAEFFAAGAADVRLLPPFFEITEDHGRDLRDWLLDGHAMSELAALAEAVPAVTAEQAAEWQPAKAKAKKGKKGEKDEKDDEGLVKLLADLITGTDRFARDAGGRLYHFANGAYRAKAENHIQAQVKALCIAFGESARWSTRLASEVVAFIGVDAPELWERPPLDVLNLANGLLRLADRQLLPHDAGHLSPVQLPVNYDPAATCPAIDKFVVEVFPPDAVDLAWEMVAWLMRPDTSIQRAILLTGEGANGKSTWLTLLTAFLGRRNVSSVSLHRLESDKFSKARLVGKLANICADLPSAHLDGTSVFKAIVGNDCLDGERKFHDGFEFIPYARLVFSANYPPRSGDGSHAFFRRWLVVPFDRTIPDEQQIDRTTLDAMLAQPGGLSGLLNHALDVLPRLATQRAFSQPASVQAAWRELYATTDPLAVWLTAYTIDDAGAIVVCETLRAAYRAAADREGRPALGDKAFGQALRRLRPGVERVQRMVGGRQQWVYAGLGMAAYDSPRQPVHLDHPDHPYLVYRRERGEVEGESQGKESDEGSSAEQERGNPGDSGESGGRCEHRYVDITGADDVIRRTCAKCGKFYGMVRRS